MSFSSYHLTRCHANFLVLVCVLIFAFDEVLHLRSSNEWLCDKMGRVIELHFVYTLDSFSHFLPCCVYCFDVRVRALREIV